MAHWIVSKPLSSFPSPDFFRDTMTEDYGPGGEPPYSNEFAVHDPGFQDGQHFGRPEHDKPDDFNNFRSKFCENQS